MISARGPPQNKRVVSQVRLGGKRGNARFAGWCHISLHLSGHWNRAAVWKTASQFGYWISFICDSGTTTSFTSITNFWLSFYFLLFFHIGFRFTTFTYRRTLLTPCGWQLARDKWQRETLVKIVDGSQRCASSISIVCYGHRKWREKGRERETEKESERECESERASKSERQIC